MSTLQISLAIIGGIVLAIVVAHSAWSARKNLPMQPTPDPVAPVIEPTVGDFAPHGEDTQPQRLEPGFDGDSGMDALTALTTPEKRPGLDALIDVIAPIVIDSVVSGEAALADMPGTRRAGSKPFAIEGLSLATGAWETPTAGQRYSAFQAGVQLANRTGALNQIEFSEFVMKAQAFADAIDGLPEFPDMMEEVARARELDSFASTHDAQLGFTLRARHTAWSPGYVHQSAAKLGFVAGSIPGRMVLPASQSGPHAPPVLGLSFDTQAAMAEEPEQTALRELTLSLDVPQVLRAEQPFVRLCEAAIALASSMDGVIIDDQGQPIRPEAMEAIHADLEQLYNTLEERDMPAGSALGRRLFS
ncbi:MAG: cell division protein FtsZ [Pseudomonadota bacterium]|uniref:cell division protein ZipA C-terminal FtsZ-binding domain-containing protein n=1 Tax=Polaromonas sp. TaxID=1869339 RepID=UPI0017DEEE8B|nr:cell division protein ZipA C-terminal FtsZ-binding domain-containing protein [Polaromonas sp.]MBA3592405.1 cell division protein FtsZ [Polaromonas sp.]MDQ3270601.1 cell division protein FtsZ [Pseudomonadota bacterium]